MKWPFGEKSTSPSGFGGQILYMSHINHYLQEKNGLMVVEWSFIN